MPASFAKAPNGHLRCCFFMMMLKASQEQQEEFFATIAKQLPCPLEIADGYGRDLDSTKADHRAGHWIGVLSAPGQCSA
jgi:hypothetical protein